MSELPKGWTLTTIGNIGKWSSGGTPSRKIASYFGGKIPWIKSGDLPDGIITKVDEFITDEALKNSAAKLLPSGTISIALYGATIGKLGIVSFPAATNQACANCVVHPEVIEKRFLYFYLLSQRKAFIDKGQGGAQPNISQEILKAHPMPLAPLKEQQRIVSKIDELLPKVDACKQRLEKIPTILKRFRQSVLADAVSGKLTEQWRRLNSRNLDGTKHTCVPLVDTPPEWTWMLLKEVCQLKGGVTKGRNLKGKKIISIPYLRVANVQDGFLDLTEMKLIEGTQEDCEKYKLLKGDILFTEGGDRDKLGRGTVWENEIEGCIHQNHIFRARVNSVNTAIPEFISLVTKSEFAKGYFFENASQSVNLASLNMTMLGQLPIPIPPISEQVKILEAFASACQHIDALTKRVDWAYTAVERTAQSVLARAYRGELVDQDPSDEPASKLLERLKFSAAEKPKKASPKKRKSEKAEQSLSA